MSRENVLVKALGIFAVVCALSGCSRVPVPIELLGTWLTSAPNYQGASMEITSETITFKDGKGYAGVNRIIGIEKRKEKDETLYKLSYEGEEGGRFVLSFYLRQVGLGKDQQLVIVYQNQKDLLWRKAPGQQAREMQG